MTILETAKQVFDLEKQEIQNVSEQLDKNFVEAVTLMLHSKGRIVISGMGKSGHIGVKISATLASTGTPSFFMHPAEAIHGDLGMLTKDDVILLISNSGESEEILRIIPHIKKMGINSIAMSGNSNSTLAKEATIFLNIHVKEEACPLQLAPTSSTTVTLVMGDALAVALMKERKFKPENFAMFHPGGSLGRKLLTQVNDIMISKNLPIVTPLTPFVDIVNVMTKGRKGVCVVLNGDLIEGIITDGDLRRALIKESKSRFDFLAQEIMTRNWKSIPCGAMAVDAEKMMIENKINILLVLNKNRTLSGIIQLYDMGEI